MCRPLLILSIAVAIVLLAACSQTEPKFVAPLFVGSATCGDCHAEQFAQWSNSHHALSMQVSSEQSVLADFDTLFGESKFSRHDGIYLASQRDQHGNENTYVVTHTFGVAPLQQYLVDMGDGRLQALRQSWDSRPAHQGGERWFHQYEDETIEPGGVLHWTQIAQNWNSMCADCHSTSLRKGFDPSTDSFETTYAEINVGCEACHGPGSQHVDNPAHPLPAQTALSNAASQAEVCAACHSRRAQISEGYTAGAEFYDYYVPALVNPPLYYSDGQILEEVYVFGSFATSKMFRQGVSCSDCHSPHSAELKLSGNATCLQCHSPAGNPKYPTLTNKAYDTSEHHLHVPDTAGARCVSCHAPTRTYMGVDQRHDHSFRIPAPHLSVLHDTPNACNQCHQDQSAQWAADVLRARFGEPSTTHFAHAFASQINNQGIEQSLTEIATRSKQASVVAATALSKLGPGSSSASAHAIRQALDHPHPLVRHTVLGVIHRLNSTHMQYAFTKLLVDPTRAVRIEAARVALLLLSPTDRSRLDPNFTSALAEYEDSQQLNAEQPAARVNLAHMFSALEKPELAEKHLLAALQTNSQFIPALLNYADLLRATNRDNKAESYLIDATSIIPSVPQAQYAYALWLVRAGQPQQALSVLASAYRSAPQQVEIAYTYAIALNSLGKSLQALTLMRQLATTHTYTERFMWLHATIAVEQDLFDEARSVVRQLLLISPDSPQYQALQTSLKGR